MSQILLTEIQNQAKSLNNRGLLTVDMCWVSTGWMSYNYLKSQYLLEGCKSEILEFLQSD